MEMLTLLAFLLFQVPQQVKPESGRAQEYRRSADIYPHPPDPQHLETYQVDITVVIEHKHWFWTTRETAKSGIPIQIQQARPKGGWWLSQTRTTDVNGHLANAVELDPTWTNPPHILVILFEGREQIASFEYDVPQKKFSREIVIDQGD